MIRILILAILALLFSGCAVFSGHSGKIAKFDSEIVSMSCDIDDYEDEIDSGDDIILNANQGASIARSCREYEKSNLFFDIAENEYKKVDEKSIFLSGLNSLGSTLTNDNILEYEGKFYERIMTNLYKALNFMSLGDMGNARVEFNRILERQRIATQYFDDEILKAENLARDKINNILQNSYQKNAQTIEQTAYENSGSILEILPNFINPFASYMAGIFFTLDGDSIKGGEYLREAGKIYPNNPQIKKDIKIAEQIAKNRAKSGANFIWLIYENGRGYAINESAFNIPFFVDEGFITLSIALPRLIRQNESYKFLRVGDETTEFITDMDAIIKTEFHKTYKLILSRSIARSLGKAIMQYRLSKENEMGAMAMAIFTILTNRADTRYWSYLPRNFQSLSVENRGNIEVYDDSNNLIYDAKIPQDKNAIIYVKSLQKGVNFIDYILF